MDVAEPTTSTAPSSSLSTSPTGPGAHYPETGPPTDMSTATSVAPTSLHDDSMNAMDAHYQQSPASNSNGASQSQAPPTVNTAAVAAVSAPSSAMTPTTTNYGVGGTLTPLGDDKVNTTATQKPKATKKKATADGDAPKKPSPRVRTPTVKGEKAEKKKTAAAAARSTPTSGNGPTAPPTTAPANQMPPTSAGYPPQNGTTPDASGANRQELLPAQDIELRKTYLQNIYRQLQMTHRNQDDAAVRQLATSIEIDLCTRAKTRSEYISLMNQQIHSLMQAELTNGSVGLQSSLYVPGHGPAVSSSMGQHEATSSATGTSQVSTSTPTYSQHGHPGYPPTSTPMNQQRPPQSNQGSFMSLLSSQAPVQSFDSSRQQHPFPPTQGRPPQYGAPNSYPGQPGPQTVGPKGEPGAPTTQPSVPAYPDQRSGPQTPTSAPPEFAAQFQRLDRNGLLDLLWTQHKTVVQYQRRLAQLEMQLGARQPSPTGMMSNPSVPPNAYYNASPRPPVGGGGVPPSLSAEAEAQRANDRRNSRPGQMPTAAYGSAPQGQPQYPVPSQMPATPTGVQNPALYWEKVRYLKDTFLRPLCLAHQALSQHNAPSSSIQSQKAENVKHNISLACSILSETPKNVQPRPIDVIDSIERFLHSTVVPIVRKVNPQAVMQPPSSGPGFGPGAPTNGQQTPRDMTDATRNSMEMKASPQVPSPSVGGVTQPGEPATAKGKAGASKPAAKPRKNPAASTKKSTPKATTPKAPKATAKKSPKQTPAKQAQPTVPQESAAVPQLAESTSTSADKGMLIENPAEDQSAIASMRSGAITDDENLNDFADFADLDFGDDLPDPLTKVQNKENAVGSNSRKRSIEDV